MTDTDNRTDVAPDDQSGDKKPFLTGTYRGKAVTWDNEEKVRTLAQKGLDYETKMQELATQREALNSEGQAFGEWKEWKRVLASDPKRARAMQKAWEDPDAVLTPRSDPDQDPDPDGAPAQRSLPPEVLALKAQVEQLQSTISTQLGRTQEQQLSDRLSRAAESFDFLSGNAAAKNLAIRQAASFMVAEPDASPEGAMAAVVEELREATTATQQRKLENKKEGEALRTVPSSEGVPNPGPKPVERDPNRLRYGKVRQEIMSTLKKDWATRFPSL